MPCSLPRLLCDLSFASSSCLRLLSSLRSHRTPHASSVSRMALVSDPPAFDTEAMLLMAREFAVVDPRAPLSVQYALVLGSVLPLIQRFGDGEIEMQGVP